MLKMSKIWEIESFFWKILFFLLPFDQNWSLHGPIMSILAIWVGNHLKLTRKKCCGLSKSYFALRTFGVFWYSLKATWHLSEIFLERRSFSLLLHETFMTLKLMFLLITHFSFLYEWYFLIIDNFLESARHLPSNSAKMKFISKKFMKL